MRVVGVTMHLTVTADGQPDDDPWLQESLTLMVMPDHDPAVVRARLKRMALSVVNISMSRIENARKGQGAGGEG